MAAPKMSERGVLAHMAKHYKHPEWAFFSHVNEGTGRNLGRIVDALAMSLYPSRGLHLHGFEIKISRGDWLRELADPAKADGWFGACHAWWIATPPDLVRKDEVPHGWGHLVVKPTGEVRAAISAPVREVPPLSWDRMAGFLRVVGKQLHGSVPKQQFQKLVDAEVTERERNASIRARKFAADMVREEKYQARVTVEAVRAFQNASGISIPLHDPEQARRLGASLRAGRALAEAYRLVGNAATTLRHAADYAETAQRELREAQEKHRPGVEAPPDKTGLTAGSPRLT